MCQAAIDDQGRRCLNEDMSIEQPSAPNLSELWEQEFRPTREWMLELERRIGDGALGEELRDPMYLPTRQEVFDYFQVAQPALSEADRKEARTRRNAILRGGVFFEHPAIREILTQEFVQALGRYVSERIEPSSTVLEVGAGSGRLAHFLREELQRLSPGVSVIAADSNAEGIATTLPVQNMDTETALKEFEPRLVICSWMPRNQDWSADFRETPSVQEYILIGEQEEVTGHTWKTWGMDGGGDTPPYEEDGFVRIDLPAISKSQVSANDRFAGAGADEESDSKTVSFRRI